MRRLDAAEREVVELLERCARERKFVREIDEAMARQTGEQAVEAESGENHVDVARRLARRDEQIGDVLAADRLLEMPDHLGQQRRQVLRAQHDFVMLGAERLGNAAPR